MDETVIPLPHARPPALPELPLRLHHHAFVVRDQEVNRRFFEDVLGLPLVATWCEKLFNPEAQREIAYCHTFFGLADGGALAFFQFADDAMYERTRAVEPPIGRFQHVALKVTRATFHEIDRRVTAAGVSRRITDHGYCRSLYVTSPDGLRVEFTVDPDDVDDINAMRRADARAELVRWLSGDHTPNNTDRKPASSRH
jgi:catechol 2,3-dioxygenase-like lactoylglutathione lyase family enzyme